MTNEIGSETLGDLERAVSQAEQHFECATETWNSFGVGSPQLQSEAAKAALVEYEHAARLLENNHLPKLHRPARLSLLAFRERVLAQVATMKHYATEDTEEQIEYLDEALVHLRGAAGFLMKTADPEKTLLFRVGTDLLHTEGCREVLLARTTAREGRVSDAIACYSVAEAKFAELMRAYEKENEELVGVGSTIRESVKKSWECDNEIEIEEMKARMIVLRFDETYQPLSDEDMYRRAAANFYSAAGAKCNLQAFEIMKTGGPTKAIEAKLTESVECIYLAMEAFPANLELHRDLLNAWRFKGERFGCPFFETESAFHTRCPIAIKEFVGKWYVSPTLEYDELTCTACGKDILECVHFPGQDIDGNIVKYQKRSVRITSASLVDVPEDPRCRIEWLSLPKKRFPPRQRSDDEFRCLICQSKRQETKAL